MPVVWLIDLADEALQVFGFWQVEQNRMILRCASAFEQRYAPVCIYGGGGHCSFEVSPRDVV
jgi:hypothetical protein